MNGIQLTAEIVKEFIPARASDSRKGQNGKVLIIGGSHIYHGAPVLASLAALRAGCDLVYTSLPNIHASAARAASPSLIILPLVDQKLTRGAVTKLLGLVPKGLDSAAIGMGLAVQEPGALVNLIKSLLDSDVRLSLDAGALRCDVLPLIGDKNVLVTPHAGEFKRLFGRDPPDDIIQRTNLCMQMAAQHRITILLKGATDVITDGESAYVLPKNTPSMTVGGTGDVLSGIAAAMLAKNRKPVESAAFAAFVNGMAGGLAEKEHGLHILPTDIITHIPAAMRPFDKVK